MTTTEAPIKPKDTIDQALRLIDNGLSELMHRELASTEEVSDLLLDVRLVLTSTAELTE